MKNKFILTLIIFLLIIFYFASNVFGASLNDRFYYPEGVSEFNIINDAYSTHLVDQILYKKDNDYYILAWYLVEGTHEQNKLYLKGSLPFSSIAERGRRYDHVVLAKFSNSGWSFLNWWYTDSKETFENSNPANSLIGAEIISTSNDIYKDITCKEIFFREPLRVTITEIAKVEELPEIMNKVLQVIIPIGLKILLVGLIIFLVRWVILQVI